MATTSTFPARISQDIWDRKYRLKDASGEPVDHTVEDTMWRVARACASVEKGGKRVRERWADRFHGAITDFGFLPAGRIIAGAGADRNVTLFNCFVLGAIPDDLKGIFDAVKDAALTMQAGGGIGHDFSTLRPNGAPVKSIGADASGPVSFMDVWDAMCRTIMSAGSRRGAMMATLSCDHPDIEAFIAAKADPARLRNFNLSVLISDAFMAAVTADAPWPLQFGGRVSKVVRAAELWDKLMRATYDYAEPGVIFIDRVNANNNLAYCETIRASNPCGEQMLPPYGACLLGSLNLAALVERPFAPDAAIDAAKLEERTRVAVRMLDNVIDLSRYPLPQQRHEALQKRRIGLGVTGLADALIFSGLRYGSDRAADQAASWMRIIQRSAYQASAELAAEKGVFPLFDREAMLARPNIVSLDDGVRGEIARHGLRNGCLTSIAPTGTISLLAGNVSSGIEPVFDTAYSRRVLGADGTTRAETVEDFAYAAFRKRCGADAPLPEYFVRTAELSPAEHLKMQAALQPHVDSGISKTINCPAGISFDDFRSVYQDAYRLGLKGCTTYRPNAVTGAVLSSGPAGVQDAPPTFVASDSADGAAPLVQGRHERNGDIVYMTKPLERDAVLGGYTYKLKWPDSDHALYVTINDIVRDGRRRPFEIFINTKNLEHYAWTVALTRMISAVFRRGGDVTFVADELKAVFDPQGGRWVGGRYVPSLLAAIGEIIERHMTRIGFIAGEAGENELSSSPAEPLRNVAAVAPGRAQGGGAPGRACPRCSSPQLVREEGCWVCRSCGFSKCE